MSIGIAYLHDSVTFGGIPIEVALTDESINGAAASFTFLVGGTPVDGLAVGGGIIGTVAPRPTIKIDGELVRSDRHVTFSWVGGFVDWYANPRRGFHLQGLLGVAGLSQYEMGPDPVGVGVGVGIGYEWWVSSQWSIGAIGRVMYANLTLNENMRGLSETHSVITPAVLFGATYH
jgi:hypothetical protein